jgi:uncharacterized membrane protein
MRLPHPLLIAAFAVGFILRFINLTGKPFWMDEVITSIFSLGQTYDAVPIGKTLTVTDLTQFLRFQPNTNCAAIAHNVMTQSVHPPLFFCGMHYWLNLFKDTGISLIWQVRSFAALIGTITIGLAYAVAQLGFQSRRIAIASAWVMAVSPFAVYLSQEGRHYTLPMAVVMLGLLCLVKIQQDWQQGKINPCVWVGWAACQTSGFYIHYFCLMASVGQIGALLLWQWCQPPDKYRPKRAFWMPVALTVSAIGCTLVPWVSIFTGHITRPETNWMKPFAANFLTFLAPVWQLPIGWISMIIALPVEGQSLWIAIPSVVASVVLTVWLIRQAYPGFLKLWQAEQTRAITMLITAFLVIVLLEFFAIIFVLQKDISQVPRYNFIYYPAICILLAASLSNQSNHQPRRLMTQPLFDLVLIGIVSSALINSNLVFQKSFRPEQVAINISSPADPPPLVVMGYDDYQEIALGLSFALALREVNPQALFLFLHRSPGYAPIIQTLRNLPTVDNFWLIGPGLRQRDFPHLVQVGKNRCSRLPERYYRIGIPYQGYKCE